ncbi:hypothetical protein NECAME_13353 [Necator americanus]|uniref:GRIP domain protein n=1 Tax=Necator americanus TaxID=51031 RepID=W2SYZ2_NECAM|nr:hypothetical protein NECAME_13353 [Necator americanus]ETN73882.1 hypothetical protein NECAME_13353 [Necator americanus]
MSASGGLSKEEFLILQEQLIALRNRNYELQENLHKKDQEIAQLSSPKSEALQFASKLMNRRDKEKELTQKYEAELDSLRVKLTTQEEEFHLQQETLISELNKVVSQNQSMQKELDQFRSCGSLYASPQAGTPCEPQPFVPVNYIQQNVNLETTPVSADSLIANCESALLSENENRLKAMETSLVEKEAMVSALEGKLLEYKESLTKLEDTVALLSEEKASHNKIIAEKEAKMRSLVEELDSLKKTIAEKEEFNSYLISSMSSIWKGMKGDEVQFADADRNSVEQDISALLHSISLNKEKNLQTQAEKKISSLSHEIFSEREKHMQELNSRLALSNSMSEDLKNKLAALEETCEKQVEDRVLLLETRYQLELSDREKSFEKEREEWSRKLHSAEASLAAKDEEKAMSLKKQAALVKELQRALREEKKRAESMERQGICCSEERGWHLVADSDAKSGQTLDGADSHSISSASALESDNAELIHRLTSLQRTHADALDRISALESENLRLNNEVEEKRELIEHWIRKRPLMQGSGTMTPSKPEGSLRRFLTTTLTGDDAINDVRDMNRKLQRMLEETLSKNIILQRDLQTLLERTEM